MSSFPPRRFILGGETLKISRSVASHMHYAQQAHADSSPDGEAFLEVLSRGTQIGTWRRQDKLTIFQEARFSFKDVSAI